MSKILITGAAGFIGSHLVDHLLKDGVSRNDIKLFVFNDESLINLPDKNFNIIRGDLRNIKDAKKAVKGVNTIYHLAALTINGEGRYVDVNLKVTKNLLSAIKGKKIKKFIFFSSIAVFGLPAFVGSKTNVNESSPKEVIGEYAQSKYKGELEILKAHKKTGLPYIIIRPTTVYGPRDNAGIYQLYRAIKKGYFVMIGSGKNKMDYVYVGDIVDGARKAQLSRVKNADYIFGAKNPISFKDIAEIIAKSINKKIPNIYLPKSLGYLCAYILEKVLKLNLPLSVDRIKVMTSNYYFDSTKAMDEINYTPKTTFKNGAQITAKWLISRGKI